MFHLCIIDASSSSSMYLVIKWFIHQCWSSAQPYCPIESTTVASQYYMSREWNRKGASIAIILKKTLLVAEEEETILITVGFSFFATAYNF